MTPEPHYSFTIPSIHDDTTLDCRIYHPRIFEDVSNGFPMQWRKRGIVMAHPYAPMGGSYDDRVVGIVVDEMLKAGHVVGTFNFRGAHGSKHNGRTSWSGRPEQDDYTTFAACFMRYMSLISPFPTPDTTFAPDQLTANPSTHTAREALSSAAPLIILGGYSYGSIILKYLPPVPSIIQRFSNPLAGSAADEVLLRALKLADQSNLDWINQARNAERVQRGRKHGHKTSVTLGGEETTPDRRRSSRDVKRSLEVPRALDLGQHLRSLSHRRRRNSSSEESIKQIESQPEIPEVRYLMVSPLTPPISTLVAPALGQRPWSRSKDANTSSVGKFVSLAVYGGQDIFASAKKIRDWCDTLKTEYGSTFSSVEITTAGHFWVEQGVEGELRAALQQWISEEHAKGTTAIGAQNDS